MAVKKKDKVVDKIVDGMEERMTTDELAAEDMEEKVKKQATAQFITVDAGKLSKGLKTTFEGVAMVFDSIGIPVTIAPPQSTAPAEKAEKKRKVERVEKVEAEPKPEPEPEPEHTTVVDTQKGEAAVEEKSPAEKPVAEPAPLAEVAAEPEPEVPAEPAPDAKNTPAAPVISIDDITKIIVQKIRQNRNSNKKIAAILKTYGVAKVSELPADKYEAFLTDLAAI